MFYDFIDVHVYHVNENVNPFGYVVGHGTLLDSVFSLIGIYFGTYHLVSLAPSNLNATDELVSYFYPDLAC